MSKPATIASIADMNSGDQSSCPLLNDYKKKFLRSRILQTLLGGIRLNNVSTLGVLSQVVILLVPLFIVVISTLANYYGGLPEFTLNILLGCFLSLISLTLMLLPRPKSIKSDFEHKSFHLRLEEENKINIKHFFSWENVEFLFPSDRPVPQKLLYSILYGLVYFVGAEITRMSFCVAVLGVSEIGGVIVSLLVWQSMCLSMFPLLSNSPPEVAQQEILKELYRPAYWGGVAAGILALSAVTFNLDLMGLYILLCCLPILFLLGVLPPLFSLVGWILDSWLSVVCGTSPPPNFIRGVIQTVLSTGLAVASHVIPGYRLVFVAVTAAILSCNILAFDTGVYKSWKFWLCSVYSVTLSAVVTVTAYATNLQASEEHLLYAFLLAWFGIVSIFRQIQGVYIFGLLRNPFYKQIYTGGSGDIIVKRLKNVEMCITPGLLLIVYISSLSDVPSDWTQTILLYRAYRRVWQDGRGCLTETSLYVIVRLATNTSIPEVVLLLICSLGITVTSRFLLKLKFCLKLHMDFLFLKKQRHRSWLLITIANTLLLPLLLFLNLFSSLLNAPLLPIFTLPVFWISHPRPYRFWNNVTSPNSSSNPDSAFYKQIMPNLLATLPTTNTAGSMYLVRCESLLLLVETLQTGFGFSSLSIKGLELQETSCHTEEVNVIKDIMDQAFIQCSDGACLNSEYLHVLIPERHTDIQTYSDAKNVLTGILDSPDCLGRIAGNFVKCLAVLLLNHKQQWAGQVTYADRATATTTSSYMGRRGHSGFDFTGLQHKTKSVLPEVVEDAKSSFSKNHSSDFLDDLSLNDSEDSWCNHVITTKSGCEDQPAETSPNKDILPSKVELPKDSEQEISKDFRGHEEWLSLPFSESEITKMSNDYPRGFFSFIEEFVQNDKEKLALEGILLSACQILCGNPGVKKTAYQVVKTYKGNYEWNNELGWLKSKEDLSMIVLKAYRHAVKLTIDEQVFGEAESLREFTESLTELLRSWHICSEEEPSWSQHIETGKEFLFSVGLNQQGLYSSRTLTLTNLPAYTGRLNPEAVRGLWAALSVELLYVTNDDEERYSIQAHPNLLRNILTQAAHIPLGYHIFSSGLQHL